jgi:peptide/nickel transport system substrate-binding protein
LIETPRPLEVVIRLRERSTFLLDDLGVSILKIQDGKPPVGTGPYVTVAGSGNELVMRAFERYYRGKPQIDRIVWRAYPTVRTAWAAMMRGEIDLLYEVGPEVREFIEPEASVRVFPFLRNYNFAVVLNSKKTPFDKPEVRRALNYAINRTHLVENALHGNGQKASGPVWPLHWAYDKSVPGYEYDPSRSIALLDSVGVPHVVSVTNPDRIPSRFSFTCLIPESFALWERMALIVQRDLAKIGVDMQIESIPFEEFNRRIGAGQFDAVTLEFIFGNSPTRPYTFWYSTSKQNVWGYRNLDVDKSLDRVRRAANETEYRDALRQFQVDTLLDPPAIFLAVSQTARAVSRRFDVVAPLGSDILPTIGDWRPAHLVEATN